MPSFLKELRRRNVVRVGVAYLVFAWLIIQITDTVAPPLGLPVQTLTIVIWLCAAGLPISLLFSWAFELTPEGLKRSEDVDPDESITSRTGGRLNAIIIVMMAATIAVLLFDRFYLHAGEHTSDSRASIAVLPFANLSDDPENEYFADGLAEELLNLLAQVDQLRVTARTSTFYFKDKNPSIEEVAEMLDVDTIVEGSVRRSGDTIRVVVQLISAEDSAHLWSERYDEPLDDLFAVQDDMANRIVAALLPHLQGTDTPAIVTDAESLPPELHRRFLLARERYHDGEGESLLVARDGFQAITEAVPDYAPAWAWLARTWISLRRHSGIDREAALAQAGLAIDAALALDPDQPMAFVAQGNLYEIDDRFAEAVESYDRAIESNGDLVDAHIARHDSLFRMNRPDEAIESLLRARTIDPLHPDVLWGLAHLFNLDGQRAEAMEAVEALWLINPTAAVNLEVHLYEDSGHYARGLYVTEAFGGGGADDLAFQSAMLGLHDAPVIQQTDFRPLSLAVMGRREEALNELEEVKQGDSSEHFRADSEAWVMIALGEYEAARDLYWERWVSQDSEDPLPGFDLPDMTMFAGLMRKLDDGERIDPVLQHLRSMVDTLNEAHAAAYHFLRGYYEAAAGNTEQAVAHFEILADEGFAGVGMYGTVTMMPWLFEQDPRLEALQDRFRENRNHQIAELERFRSSQLTLEQIRAEYVTNGAQKEGLIND